MYWMLECYGPETEDRAAVSEVTNDEDFSWNLGRRFEIAPPDPLEVRMEPGLMVPMFNRGILLFSDAMLDVLASVGVDNLDTYPAVLVDIESEQQYLNYRAVNILGLVAAADLSRSSFTSHSSSNLIDTDFESLAIDGSRAHGFLIFRLAEAVSGIVIHDRLKQAFENAGIEHLDFIEPSNWAG
jgi:hypothetical protein